MPLSITNLSWCLHRGFTGAHIQCFIPPPGNMFPCRLWLLLGRAVASLLCTELHGNAGGVGVREGRVPRPHVSSSPQTQRISLSIPIILFPHTAGSHTHTHAPSSIEPYAPAPETRIHDARSPISISLMISLQARIDHLCCRPRGAIRFNRSDVNVASVSAERR